MKETPSLLASGRGCAERRGAELGFRQLTQAVEQCPVSIVVTNLRGEIEYVNRKFTEVTGYTAEEALGKNARLLKSGELDAGVYRKLWETIQAGGEWHGELHNRRKNGELFWERASISAVRDAEGNITHFLAIKEDIEERKRADAELEQTNQALEQALARAQELTIKAEMASIAKSEFLARMSHEIRTPMNGVIGMTGLLLDTPLNETQRKYAGIVRSSAEALLEVINDILDFSKVEARKLKLEIIDFDLGEVIDDILEMMALRAQSKGLELLGAVAPDVPLRLCGDPGRLRQVIVNLVGNAIKFTAHGEVLLRVSTESASSTSARLRFEIVDTGIGIPEDKIGGLFAAFTQVDGSHTRKYGGTGLGLAISRQLAELMGGEAGVSSVMGQGSTFWFTARLETRPAFAPPPVGTATLLRGLRILVADDNANCRRLAAGWLRECGARTVEAADGHEVLAGLRRSADAGERVDAVLLDLGLPGMEDAALGRSIRESPMGSGIKLVLMSALGAQVDAEGIAGSSHAGTLTKPLRPARLQALVAEVLGRASRAPTAQTKEATAANAATAEVKARYRILVAEDNPTNQLVALGMLRKLGYHADLVTNGREALQRLAQDSYDLVLMDCQMPEMDGFEAVTCIRANTPPTLNPRVPVVAMTADAMQSARDACLAAGMDDYLSKPIALALLSATLKKWLPAAPAADGAAAAAPARPARPEGEALVFDHAGLMKRVMHDERLARVVLGGFLQDMPQQLAILRRQTEAGNGAQVGQQAHRIRGASANVGGGTMQAVAQEIEKLGKDGNLQQVSPLLTQLETQFTRMQEQIAETLQHHQQTQAAS